MHLHFCALFPAYVRHLVSVKLILKFLRILASFTTFVTAMAKGLVGGDVSDVPELGSFYSAYVPNSKPELRPPPGNEATISCSFVVQMDIYSYLLQLLLLVMSIRTTKLHDIIAKHV